MEYYLLKDPLYIGLSSDAMSSNAQEKQMNKLIPPPLDKLQHKWKQNLSLVSHEHAMHYVPDVFIGQLAHQQLTHWYLLLYIFNIPFSILRVSGFILYFIVF